LISAIEIVPYYWAWAVTGAAAGAAVGCTAGGSWLRTILAGGLAATAAFGIYVAVFYTSSPREILFDLAARLTDLGFRVAPAAKGQRAHWLASGEAPEAVRASPPTLTPVSTLDDAIAAVLLANLQQFVANWPALSMARPEVVHQMRVALRRLRAALGLPDPWPRLPR
jgi:hypothetical protein